MKYIRYLLLLLFEALLVGGVFLLAGAFQKLGIGSLKMSGRGISTLATFLIAFPLASFARDRKIRPLSVEGVKNNYLKQESEFNTVLGNDWKATMKDIMNGMAVENQLFSLDYEEDKLLIYRPEGIGQEIGDKKRKVRKNRIIVEIECRDDGEVGIVAHKENQFTELGNAENKEAVGIIATEIMRRQEEASLPMINGDTN